MTSAQRHALDYLQRHRVLSLATFGPEGVWAAAVFYVNDGFRLYFLSAPTSRHARNIESAPRVAGTIQEESGDWREIQGVQLEGEAVRIAGPEQVAARLRYGEKFPLVANLASAPQEIVRALERVAWYRLLPSRLYFIDNSRGLGHREEVSLSA
jgi:uncharacterized protein YhbP (UPF0306 family)